MYEARQNKEKVSRRINEANKETKQKMNFNRRMGQLYIFSGKTIQLKAVKIYCNINGTYEIDSKKSSFNERELFLIRHKSHPNKHYNYGEIAISKLKENGTIPKNAQNIRYNITTYSK